MSLTCPIQHQPLYAHTQFSQSCSFQATLHSPAHIQPFWLCPHSSNAHASLLKLMHALVCCRCGQDAHVCVWQQVQRAHCGEKLRGIKGSWESSGFKLNFRLVLGAGRHDRESMGSMFGMHPYERSYLRAILSLKCCPCFQPALTYFVLLSARSAWPMWCAVTGPWA